VSQVNQAGSYENDQAVFILTIAGILLVCWLFFDDIVSLTCTILYWLWRLADMPQIHTYAAPRINLLARAVNHASGITFDKWLDIMNQTSGILFIFVIPVTVAGLAGMAFHPSLPLRSKRIVNIYTLPGIIARFSPAITPVLAGSKSPDMLMNDERPERRWPMTPEEFAEQHGLIETRILNREKAHEAFRAQLGPEFTTPDALQDYEKALFTVFGLQVFLGKRKEAKKLLDDLNRSCLGKGRRNRDILQRPQFSLADRHFPAVWNTPQMRELQKTHRYTRTALAGLAGRDIHLPGSQYRWLKGIDRTLWYALHSADTQSVFVEGAGILSQARFEKVARQEGLDIRIDFMAPAIDGLQMDLQNTGRVHEHREPDIRKKHREPDWVPATLGAEDFLPQEEAMTAPPPDALAQRPDLTDETHHTDTLATDAPYDPSHPEHPTFITFED